MFITLAAAAGLAFGASRVSAASEDGLVDSPVAPAAPTLNEVLAPYIDDVIIPAASDATHLTEPVLAAMLQQGQTIAQIGASQGMYGTSFRDGFLNSLNTVIR